MKSTVPLSVSLRPLRMRAAEASMAVCVSWPQACIVLATVERGERSCELRRSRGLPHGIFGVGARNFRALQGFIGLCLVQIVAPDCSVRKYRDQLGLYFQDPTLHEN